LLLLLCCGPPRGIRHRYCCITHATMRVRAVRLPSLARAVWQRFPVAPAPGRCCYNAATAGGGVIGAAAAALLAASAQSEGVADDGDVNPFEPGFVPAPLRSAPPPMALSDNCAGGTLAGDTSPFAPPAAPLRSEDPEETPQQKAGRNIVLGDPNVPEEERPHRVALCEWPADQAKHNGEPRTATARALFKWLNKNGYDGIEATAPWFASKFFAGMPMDDVARAAKKAAEQQGMKIFGANVWWCESSRGPAWEAPES
jgi:hypothetical protein